MAATMEKGYTSEILQTIAEFAGAKEPIIRLLVSILISYVIAAFQRSVLHKSPAPIKHIYFIITGLVLAYFNYGYGTIHSLGTILVNYVALLVIGGTPLSVLLSIVGNLGYLVGGYIYMSTDDYDVNWTTPQCVLTLRLIGLAWDLYDGHQPESKQTNEQKLICIKTPPSPIEILGYCYFCGGFFVGPQFPIKRYYDFVNERLLDNSKGNPPDSVQPALMRLGQGCAYITMTAFIAPVYSNEYLLSDTFLESSFLYKVCVLAVWGEFTLWKYCSAWLISEGVCILSGLTYEGLDASGAPNWKGCNSVRLSKLETATTLRQVITAFNINTNIWVARYVYKRLKFLGNKLTSQAASLVFLSIWHGYYVGYYICFFFELIMVQFELQWVDVVKKTNLSQFLNRPVLTIPLGILQRLYTAVFMGYPLVAFVLLRWHRIFKFKEILKDVPQEKHDDIYLLRFLRAREFDLKKTEDLFRKDLEWRLKMNTDTILTEYVPPEVLTKYWGVTVIGCAKDGSLLYLDSIGKRDVKGLMHSSKVADILKFSVQQAEMMSLKTVELNKKLGRDCGGVTNLWDLDGFGGQWFWKPWIDLSKKILGIWEQHYPELLNGSIIFNIPKTFMVLYAILKPFVREGTRKKFVFLGSDWKTQLLTYVDADVLPEHLGGTRVEPEDDYKRMKPTDSVPKSYYLKDANISDRIMTTREVKSAGTLEFMYEVRKPRSVLSYEFKTEEGDIGFSVKKLNKGGTKTDIVGKERYNSHIAPEDGQEILDEPGIYVVKFDNTYSLMRSKKLSYFVELLEPIDDDEEPQFQEQEGLDDFGTT